MRKKASHELLVNINNEDKKVAFAVEKAIPQIERKLKEMCHNT